MTQHNHRLHPILHILLVRYWWVGAIFCYIIITNFLLWPYPARAATTVIHEGDPVHQLWTLRWVQHVLFTEPLQLFNANSNYPYHNALVLNQPMYSNALLTAPIYALTKNQILTFNFGVIGSFVFSGVFVSLLVYELTKSRSASIISGVIYAFSPVRQAHIAHLNILSSYWTPLVLWGVHRIIKPSRRFESSIINQKSGKFSLRTKGSMISAFVVCFALVAQVLSEYYHTIYLATALFLLVGWKLMLQWSVIAKRAVLLLVSACLIGFLVTLPIVLITAREWNNLDLIRPLSTHDQYGARLTSYIATDQPLPLKPLLEKIPGSTLSFQSVELALYPGIVAVCFAALALIVTPVRQRVDMFAYLLIGIVAFYFSLGPTIRVFDESAGISSPLYRWFYANVPSFQGARIPARWGILVQLSVAVLAGYTVAYLVSLCNRVVWIYLITWLAVIAVLFDFWGAPGQRGIKIDTWKLSPIIEQALNTSSPGAVLHYPLTNANENLPYLYEYLSTSNWRPIVNSGSNITPSAYIDARDVLNSFPQRQSVKLLQALGVKYVVVHRSQISGWQSWWNNVSTNSFVNILAYDSITQDALLGIESSVVYYDISAERLSFTKGSAKLYLMIREPQIIDKEYLYYQQRSRKIGLEEENGNVIYVNDNFPTYIYKNQIISLQQDLVNIVAIQIPTDTGNIVRISIRNTPQPAVITEGLQLFGVPFTDEVQSGEFLQCLMYGRGTTTENLVLSLTLWDKTGKLYLKQDRFFDEGFAPPEQWEHDHSEPIACNILIPDDLPTGEYKFSVSLYNSSKAQSIPFSTPDGSTGTYWERSVYVRNTTKQ